MVNSTIPYDLFQNPNCCFTLVPPSSVFISLLPPERASPLSRLPDEIICTQTHLSAKLQISPRVLEC